MKRSLGISISAAVVVLALSIQTAVAVPPTFTQTRVAVEQIAGEPRVLVDNSSSATRGTVYYSAPYATLYVSTNGGASFSPRAAIQNQGDWDIAVDAGGNVFSSGLLDPNQTLVTTVPVQTLTPGGASVIRTRFLDPSATGIDCDRQWTAAHLINHVVTSARCGSTDQIWTSTDAWIDVQGPFTIDTQVNYAGPLVFAPNGDLFQAYEKSDGTYVARSSDEGQTWTDVLATTQRSATSGDGLFPVVDVDSAGNLYLAFSAVANSQTGGTGASIFFLQSLDNGTTWSDPVPLSSQVVSLDGRVPTSIFPWVSAGGPGKVAVSWYQARDAASGNADISPDLGMPTTKWDVMTATSANANTSAPTWSVTTAVSGFHTGSICTSGLGCIGPQNALGAGNVPTPYDRRVLDFFGTSITPDGYLLIAYPKDRALTQGALGDLVLSWMDYYVARQTGGDLLR